MVVKMLTRSLNMLQTRRKFSRTPSAREPRPGKHRFDELVAARMAKHLVMFEPSEEIITELVARARLSIPGLAPASEALKVQRHNPNCVMALARKSKFDPAAPSAEGFIAMLPLNSLGLELLAHDALEASRPNVKSLASADERPKAIYWWGIYAPGPLAAGIALFMEKLAAEQYAGIPIYARPVTDEGRNFLKVLGFTEGAKVGDLPAPDLWRFTRVPAAPLYDSYVPHSGTRNVGIAIARSFDDLMRVAAVRNSVYIGEQECPYEEEYDGNDLCATHLLAYIGDEPVGCMRLRFFADFAKFERVAVRKEYRNSRAAIQLIKAGLKLCQKKGYARVIGHAQSRLAAFWTRFGFKPMEGRTHFVFSDFDYVEMVAELERDPDAITLQTDPYVAIRPEGRWHMRGILEQSADRPASSSSAAKKH
jgi:predicted GNAT family N-acyltransferase